MNMNTKKSPPSYKHVTLQPNENLSLFILITALLFSPTISQNKLLLQHNIPNDKENKYLHTKMIIVSLIIQILLKRFPCTWVFKLGTILEDTLNGKFSLRKNESIREEESEDFISILGRIDTRKDLNKDIKHGDARYYPALSIMASKLVYENKAVIKKIVSQNWKMEFVKFFNCYNVFQREANTQAFLMREKTREDDKIILAFRGTSPFIADDWSTDFDFSWCKIDGIRGKTHKGFMIALGLQKYYHEDKDKYGDYSGYFPNEIEHDPNKPIAYYVIRDKLNEIMASNERAKFIITGHSLGGALATLFPAILASQGEYKLLHKLEGIYTYGQPRVGNDKFGIFMKEIFQKYNIKYYRFVYGYDIVPHLPLDNTSMTFKHFGTSIHFNSFYNGKIVEEEQQKNNEKEGHLDTCLGTLRETVLILMNCIIARLIAVWELIRGLIIGYTAGPYYREGWLLIAIRTLCGLFLPEGVNHNPQDYVNATMLASEDLFKYYHALKI